MLQHCRKEHEETRNQEQTTLVSHNRYEMDCKPDRYQRQEKNFQVSAHALKEQQTPDGQKPRIRRPCCMTLRKRHCCRLSFNICGPVGTSSTGFGADSRSTRIEININQEEHSSKVRIPPTGSEFCFRNAGICLKFDQSTREKKKITGIIKEVSG